ncbi:MAG: polyprenyl synthetase family protein [Clostridia bacterium]|nr:polyprenyl synthetase family protein [Clostridia bacterium]
MIRDVLAKFAEKFNKDIEATMNELRGGQLVSAMRYAVTGGGKRLRPFLLLVAAEMGGLTYDEVYPLMVGIELVHSYSLVHDDLPCMDDDDFRRGRKSTHAVYGEAMGVLAGDALLNYAYEYMLQNATKAKNIGGYITAISCIMVRAGYMGMVGGQSYDIDEEVKKHFKREDFINMYSAKTGALFQAALGAGAFAAGLPEASLTALLKCGTYLGVAFQLKDDLADAVQDAKVSEGKEKKPCLTALSTFTPESAAEFVALERDVAKDAVRDLPGSENLVALIDFLLSPNEEAQEDEKEKTEKPASDASEQGEDKQ